MFAPLNEEELVIMGGSDEDGDIKGCVYTFNTLTHSTKQVIYEGQEQNFFNFHGGINAAMRVAPNRVLA